MGNNTESTGLELIALERARQVEHGYTPEHDMEHADCSLRAAAAHLLESPDDPTGLSVTSAVWGDGENWIEELYEKHRNDEVRRLVIAGALIAAEIDRQTANTTGLWATMYALGRQRRKR